MTKTLSCDDSVSDEVRLVGHQNHSLVCAGNLLAQEGEDGLCLPQGGGVINSHHNQEAGHGAVQLYHLLQLKFFIHSTCSFQALVSMHNIPYNLNYNQNTTSKLEQHRQSTEKKQALLLLG